MKDEELRKSLETYRKENEQGLEMFENPSYDKSIVGISSSGQLVYDYEKMVEEFMEDNNCDYDEAVDFIDYNTMRSLPYEGEYRPIVIIETPDSVKERY